MKKTPKVDAYDPVIYPRKLWVTGEVEGLDKLFQFNKTDDPTVEDIRGYNDLLDETESGTGVLVTCPVTKKSTGEYGVIIIILRPEDLNLGDEAHEAVHFADYVFEQLGMYSQSFSNHNEQYAYLVGWAAGCICKTLLNLKRDYDTRREHDDVETGIE